MSLIVIEGKRGETVKGEEVHLRALERRKQGRGRWETTGITEEGGSVGSKDGLQHRDIGKGKIYLPRQWSWVCWCHSQRKAARPETSVCHPS